MAPPKQYLTIRSLILRGWPRALIAQVLGAPDAVRRTPMGTIGLYRIDRIQAAENESLEVAAALLVHHSRVAFNATQEAKHFDLVRDRLAWEARRAKRQAKRQGTRRDVDDLGA